MIQDSVNRISYDGNGIATEFAYPFSITSPNDVKIMIVDTDGTETILTNDYTVDDVNSKVTYPGYPAGEEPPAEDQPPILAVGQRIVIYRELDVTQLTSLFDQYPFKTIETMIDKVTILLQQIKDAQQRALTLSVSTDTGVSLVLPAPAANKSFRWNSAGTALELTADPATVLASVQGYTEQAEGYATTANEKAVIATNKAVTATEQANLAKDYANSIAPSNIYLKDSDQPSFRNKIINGNFAVNQDAVSGTVVLTAGQYGHDMWKAGASGCTYTFATVANITTLTISAGSLIQIVEGINLQSGTYVLSWVGTAQGKIGAGSYGASGVTGTVTGGANMTVEFGTGTLSNVQIEEGSVATTFEQRPPMYEELSCMRYYEKLDKSVAGSQASTNETGRVQWVYKVPKRVNPTINLVGSTTADTDWCGKNHCQAYVVAGVAVIGAGSSADARL